MLRCFKEASDLEETFVAMLSFDRLRDRDVRGLGIGDWKKKKKQK